MKTRKVILRINNRKMTFFPTNIKKEQIEDLIARLQLPRNRSSDVPTTSISGFSKNANNKFSMGIDIQDPNLKNSSTRSKAQRAQSKMIANFVNKVGELAGISDETAVSKLSLLTQQMAMNIATIKKYHKS